jgi:hypothetical protein
MWSYVVLGGTSIFLCADKRLGVVRPLSGRRPAGFVRPDTKGERGFGRVLARVTL